MIITACYYMHQFNVDYKEQSIGISGENNTWSVTIPGKETILIEHGADGWYKTDNLELYWTDHDIAAIGALIEQKYPSGFHGIPFN